MLSTEYVLELVRNLISENRVKNINQVLLNSKLIEDLMFDSLMIAQLIMKIQDDTGENLFEIGVDLSKLITVHDLLNSYNEQGI